MARRTPRRCRGSIRPSSRCKARVTRSRPRPPDLALNRSRGFPWNQCRRSDGAGLPAACRVLWNRAGARTGKTRPVEHRRSKGVVVRNLKLQMQMTIDGFVAGPIGQLDWMSRAMDPQLIAFINQLTDTSSTILLGRTMTPGFVAYWEGVLKKPDSPEHDFARKMVDLEKV